MKFFKQEYLDYDYKDEIKRAEMNKLWKEACKSYSDYFRTEYRNLCHSDDLSNRCKPGRKENRIRAFIFQHYRNLIIPYSILYWKCNLSF